MQRNICFLACFFVCAFTRAQQYPFVYYTPKDGLVNSRVKSIKQDTRGRMYFLTHNGLSVYDGTRFTNYHKENGLSNELVNDILEISADSFLVATNTTKLNKLVKGKISLLKTKGNHSPLINGFIKTTEGEIYLAADEGLFILKNDEIIHIPLIYDNKEVGKFLNMVMEWNNYLLILPWDQGGLMLFDKRSKKLNDILLNEKVFSVTTNKTRGIWVQSAKGIENLDTTSISKGQIKLTTLPSIFTNTVGKTKGKIFFDRKGHIYIYGAGSLHKISNGQINTISSEQGLKMGAAFDIYEDKEGLIWIATDGNGVVKWRGTDMQLINSLEGKPSVITALANYADTVWLYNDALNAIHFIHPKGKGFYPLKETDLKPQNIHPCKNQLYLTDLGKVVWIENKHSSLSYKNKKTIITGQIESYGSGTMDPYGAMILNTQNAFNEFSLTVFKNGRNIFKYRLPYTSDQLALDKKGRLWVITRSDHLLIFSIHPERPDNYLQLEKDYSSQLKGMNLRSMAIDSTGNIWLGTRNNGLYCLQFNEGNIKSIRNFTTKEGLTDNFIYSLACDKNNTIWIGSQSGLDRIFFKQEKYIIGNTGRINNWYQTVLKLIATPSGSVWALTGEGLIHISDFMQHRSAYYPKLYFTSVSVNNRPAMLSGEFDHKQNNISFSVAAPSYVDENSILYSYILEESGNGEWSEPSNISTFNFINLSPGNYNLKIRCDFPEQMYAPAFISHAFIITPPWWQTWQARILFGMLVIGSSVMLVRFYYKRKMERQKALLEKQQAVERERTRIATDMHDDLGAGLSRIKFLSETIGIKKQQHQPIEEDISKIREYSHEMIDKMGEIVWALNEKNDSLSDLLAYTRAYAMEYLSQNAIRCIWEMPDLSLPQFVSGEFRRNIFLTVKEALHNIIKHSQADQVNISVETGKMLVMSIQDNGRGFKRSEVRMFSNGLTNMEKRMKDISGKCEINNSHGTTIYLAAPLS